MGEKAPPAEQGREPSKCELRSSVAYVTAMPDRVPHAIVEWYNAVPSGNVVWRPQGGKGDPLCRGLFRIGVMPGGGKISLHFTSLTFCVLDACAFASGGESGFSDICGLA